MQLPALAQAVLDVAAAAVPGVSRRFLAAGPSFARTCELLAVYASLGVVESVGASGATVSPIAGGCASMFVPQVTLVYAKDCWPMPDDQHRPPKLPDPAVMSAWSTEYMGNCQAIADAILDAHYAGQFGGDCTASTVGPVAFTGPTSGVATMQVPVSVRPA